MISILETLRTENCHFVTYGMVPKKHLGEISGLGKVSAWITRTAFKVIKWMFRLEQRKTYWQKFRPRTESSLCSIQQAKSGLT